MINFEEVVECLENTEKRKEFILRLKHAGANSTPFLNLQSAMTGLKMNKAPRGIDQKTTLQYILKFTDPGECFQSFRLVCKSWKNAVETIKFNRKLGCVRLRYGSFFGHGKLQPHVFDDIFKLIDEIIDNFHDEMPKVPPYFEKYLQCFKKLEVPMQLFSSENGRDMISLVLKNMQKLNHIKFESDEQKLPETIDPFMIQMLENSHETLQYTSISRFCIPDISFPKLETLRIEIGKDICLPEFKTYFPQVLKNSERLETVELRWDRDLPACYNIFEYVVNNYEKHCIRGCVGRNSKFLNFVPVKIVTRVFSLEFPQNLKYVSGVQYLHVTVGIRQPPMLFGWDKYKEFFDQCLNLKEIELHWNGGCRNKSNISETSEANQIIWQERIENIKARGIRFVNDGKIFRNKNLEMKVAKESGVTWKFVFC